MGVPEARFASVRPPQEAKTSNFHVYYPPAGVPEVGFASVRPPQQKTHWRNQNSEKYPKLKSAKTRGLAQKEKCVNKKLKTRKKTEIF